MKAIVQSETKYGVSVFIQKPQLRYLDEFIMLACAVDMLAWKLFPNAKEITESMAAYRAVRSYFWRKGWSPSDKSITAIIVGDGSTPRTGALFALRTAWTCHSVDPALSKKNEWACIERLHIHRKPIEECIFNGGGRYILIAVHSHANLEHARQAIKSEKVPVVSIPCCVPQTIADQEPNEIFEDMGIASPERTVKVWF